MTQEITQRMDELQDEIAVLRSAKLGLLQRNGKMPRAGTVKAKQYHSFDFAMVEKMVEWRNLDKILQSQEKQSQK